MTARRDWLLVYSLDAQERARLFGALSKCSRFASTHRLRTGWLAADYQPFGTTTSAADARGPRSPWRFALGEELLTDRKGTPRAELTRRLDSDPADLGQLDGDFSFAVTEADGSCCAVRACSGEPGLYVHVTKQTCVVGTRLRDVSLLMSAGIEANPIAIALMASGWAIAPNHETQVRGIKRIPRGHFAFVRPGELHVGRYWRPERAMSPAPSSRPQLATQLKQTLVDSLASRLPSKETSLVLFSGGIDSSVLSALAARVLGRRLRAITLLPPPTDRHYERERHFGAALSELFQQQEFLDATTKQLRALVTHAGGYATGSFWALPAHTRAVHPAGSPSSTIMTGLFADECFGIHRKHDWVRVAAGRELPGLCRDKPPGQAMLKAWLRQRYRTFHAPVLPRRLPSLFTGPIHEKYESLLSEQEGALRSEHPSSRLLWHLQCADWSAMLCDTFAVSGMQLAAPFSSRQTVELAFASPPQLLFRRGVAKIPLRDVGYGLVPGASLWRQDDGDWSPPAHSASSTRWACDAVTNALNCSLVGGWLDKEQLRSQSNPSLETGLRMRFLMQSGAALKELSDEQISFKSRQH